MAALRVLVAGVKHDVLHAAAHEAVVALAVRVTRVRHVRHKVFVGDLVKVMIAGHMVAGAVVAAELALNRTQEFERPLTVAVILAVLKVTQLNHKVELTGVEEIRCLTELREGMRVDAGGILVIDAADRLHAVVNIRHPAERGNQILFGRNRNVGGGADRNSLGGAGGRENNEGCSSFKKRTAIAVHLVSLSLNKLWCPREMLTDLP